MANKLCDDPVEVPLEKNSSSTNEEPQELHSFDIATVPSKEVKDYEDRLRLAEKAQAINLKDRAFYLMIACGIALLLLYIIDIFLVNLNLKNSELLSSTYELLKFLLSSLIGVVFSTKLLSNNSNN